MSSKVQDQANKVKESLFSPATAETYSTAIALTWNILKETAQLLWLVLCLGLVFGDWFWKKSYQTGQSARTWVDQRQHAAANGEGASESSPPITEAITTGEFWSNTGKSLLEAGKTATTLALTNAKKQLGIEVTEAESKPTTATPPAVKPPVVAQPTPAPSSPIVSEPEKPPTETP
jgi:hypothetical protein